MPRHGVPHGCRCTRTFLGAPPTPRFGVSEAKLQTPGAENAPRERDGLFDIVRWELPKTVRRRAASSVCAEPPHPEERACASAAANQVARARVSKDGAAVPSSCFETHRSAAEAVAAAVLARCVAPQHEGPGARRILASQSAARALTPTCGCGKRSPAWFPCFRPVLYRERRNFNVSSRRLAGPPICGIEGVGLYI